MVLLIQSSLCRHIQLNPPNPPLRQNRWSLRIRLSQPNQPRRPILSSRKHNRHIRLSRQRIRSSRSEISRLQRNHLDQEFLKSRRQKILRLPKIRRQQEIILCLRNQWLWLLHRNTRLSCHRRRSRTQSPRPISQIHLLLSILARVASSA